LRPVWGLDDEFEIRGAWRDSGHPGLFFMLVRLSDLGMMISTSSSEFMGVLELNFFVATHEKGNLALCRFHSKQLAIQIKAIEEDIMGERYSG
jgi:hypothetical protein